LVKYVDYMRIRFYISALFLFGVISYAQAQEGQAERHFLEGRWKLAVKEYEDAVRANPTAGALNRLGQAHFYAGDYEAAERAFREALGIEENPESMIYLAMVEAATDKGKMGALTALAEKYGESALLLRAAGVALLKHNDREGALGNLLSSAVKDPRDYMTHFYIGLIHERGHRYDEAIEAYKRSIELNPVFAQAINNLGYSYKERRYYTYAIEKYEEAISIDPENAGFHYNLGNALSHKGMAGEALDSYRRAVELDPGFAKAHYNLGRSYIGLGLLEDGIRELRLYIKHWDRALVEAGAPTPEAVREEIRLLDDMVRERKGR